MSFSKFLINNNTHLAIDLSSNDGTVTGFPLNFGENQKWFMNMTGGDGACYFTDSSDKLHLAPLKKEDNVTTVLTARDTPFTWRFSCRKFKDGCNPITICDPDTNLCVQDNGEIGKELPLVTGSSDVSQLWIYGGLD